jgi:hypothetical protein
MTHRNFLKTAASIAAAAALAASLATGTVAAPIGMAPLAVKEAVQSDVIEVGRRGRRNTAIALGILGGIWFGSALASRHHYGPVHAQPYAYGPVYSYGPAVCPAWDPVRRRQVHVYC